MLRASDGVDVAALPGAFNLAFGEMTVLLGGLLLGAGISLAAGWSLLPLAVTAFVAGAAAIVGRWLIQLELTRQTVHLRYRVHRITGLGGVAPIRWFKNRVVVCGGAAVMLVAA